MAGIEVPECVYWAAACLLFSLHLPMELAGIEGFTTAVGWHDVSMLIAQKNQSIR